MAPMQLGGLPDLVNSINGSAMHAIHQGIKPDLKALVNRHWPNNQITGQPLKFLCQIDVFQWMAVIHFLTFESWAEKGEAAPTKITTGSAAPAGVGCLNGPSVAGVVDPDSGKAV